VRTARLKTGAVSCLSTTTFWARRVFRPTDLGRFVVLLNVLSVRNEAPEMRTTLTLADELAARAKRDAERFGASFKELINRALEIGLEKLETGRKSVGIGQNPLGWDCGKV
jgi:hypothetical protein